ELDRLRVAAVLDLEAVGAGETTGALDDAHLTLLRHRREPAGQLADHPVLPSAQPVGIEARLAELDTVLAHLPGFLDDAGRVQQRLRRNAADVQADAAERRVALDQRHVQTEIGRAERRRVTARTGSEHDEAFT